MKGFLNNLDFREIGEKDGRIVYKLNSPLFYVSDSIEVVIPVGFETDLASVPRVPVVYTAWGDKAHREAVLHDYLYRIDSKPVVERDRADYCFKEAMISRGQPLRVYYPMWLGVRIGGGSSFHKICVQDSYKLDVTY